MRKILEFPQHGYRRNPVEELGLLVDAADYYREFYRAALTAKHTLVLTGWQFDSKVPLLRGADEEGVSTPVTLLKFLNHLCDANPQLQIWILAWDFNMVFAAEREWMQQLIFDWSTNERLHFRLDSTHVDRACHHQKFVVIDGELSFLGGMDLCEDRWDDRKHRAHNPDRLSRGKPHKPYHDIQAFVRGRDFAASLLELFARRWERAGGEDLLAALEPKDPVPSLHKVQSLLPLKAQSATLSRTDPHAVPEGDQPCTEILALHLAAIASAEKLIYAETQYFSSHAIVEALELRMRQSGRPRLQLVFILNMRGESLKEMAAVGLAQAQNITRLRKVAAETGHPLGLYYTLPSGSNGEGPKVPTYIHSKIMIVDDRFLTIGSANLTNRSLGVDTELNLTVEAESEDDPLTRSICQARASLLSEHTGGAELHRIDGLVAALDRVTAEGRLQLHPSPTDGERAALELIDPQGLPWDPDHVEDLDDDQKVDVFNGIARTFRELFASKQE